MLYFLKKKIKKNQLEISLFYTCVPRILNDMISSWDRDLSSWQTEIGNHWLIFPFYPLPPPPIETENNRILNKWKNCWRYHYFTNVCQKPQLYEAGFLRYRERHFFCHFGQFAALLPSPLTTNEKATGDVLILHMCTKNHDHIMYASSDMERARQFFVILGHFLLFYPTIDPRNENLEKMYKNPGDIILLHMCNINEDHMMYDSCDIKAWWTEFLVILHLCTTNDNHTMYGS